VKEPSSVLILLLSAEEGAAYHLVIMSWDEWHQSAASQVETSATAAVVATAK